VERLPLSAPALAKGRTLRGLRLAWADSLAGVTADSATRAVLMTALAALEGQGCHTEQALPAGFSFEEAFLTWGRVQGFELACGLPAPLRSDLVRWLYRMGPVRLVFGPGLFSQGLGLGMASGSRSYFEALDARRNLTAAMDAFLAGWDAWLTPVAATPAFTHRRTGTPIEVDGATVSYSMANGAFSCPTALTGHPVVTLPAGWTASGLPVGLQLHGRRGTDLALLELAGQLAEVLGVERRWPA
jgi:amidase